MSYRTTRRRRILAGVLAGAMALTVTPILGFTGTASAADPLPPIAEPIGPGNVCENAPTANPFSDVAASDSSYDEILCLVASGLTTGTTATTYTPAGNVTRRQMALFIKRLIDLANANELVELTDLPAYDGTPDFSDLAAEPADFAEAIGQLSQANIVGGFPDGTYRPNEPVSRRQMAAFINRAQEFISGSPFPITGDYFDDDNGDSGEDNLDATAGAGIFQGDGQGNVFPGANITRRQMANVLLRHLQANFAAGNISALFVDFVGDFNVQPQDDVTQDLGTTRTYTVAGLDDSAVYRVTLVNTDNITDRTTDPTFVPATMDAPCDVPYANPGPTDAVVASVNGTALDTPARSVGSNSPDGGTLTFTITSDAPATVAPVVYTDNGPDGGCTLLELGADNRPTEMFGIGGATTFAAGDTNFPIDISPQEPAANFITQPHTFTVSADDATATPAVDLIVVPRNAVNINEETGEVHFEDDDADGFADFVDAVVPGGNINGATITSINSVNPVGGATPYVNNQTLASGPVTVTLNTNVPDEVYLLAFNDANGDNRLPLAADLQASEAIGLSGYKVWTGPEAEFSAGAGDGTANFQVLFGGNVVIGSRFIDFFDLFAVTSASVDGVQVPGARMEYDDDDVFRIDGALVNKAQFEAALSPGDTIEANYNPAGVSEFDIVIDVGYNAPMPGAVVTNLDGSGGENDVLLSIVTPGDNQVFAEYMVQRASSAGPDGICNTADDFTIAPGPLQVPSAAFATIPTIQTDIEGTPFVSDTVVLDRLAGEDPGDLVQAADLNPGDGCYFYRTQVVDPNTAEVRNSAIFGPVNVPAPPDLVAPVVIQSVFKDPANPNQLGPNDVIDLIFSEQVVAEAGDEIQIEDGPDGEFVTIVLGTGNDFTVTTRGGVARNAQTQIQITITDPITVTGDNDANNANNDGIIDFTGIDQMSIQGADGIADLAGNDWEPAGLLINEDNDGPFIADDETIEGANTFSVFFNEAVDPATAGDAANYLVNNNGNFTPGNGGANPVLSAVVSNAGYLPQGVVIPPFIRGWTEVRLTTQFAVGQNTVVSQTVSDKLGNSGDFDTQAGPYALTAGGIVTIEGGAVNEGGTTDTLDVTLARQVTQPVTVDITSDDTGECTIAPAQLVFPVGPAGQVMSTTVTGVDDPLVDGTQNCTITATASSSDPQYDGAVDTSIVTNDDNDVAGIETDPAAGVVATVTEGGANDTFDVRLTAQPDGNVNVAVTGNADVNVTGGAILNFTPANWNIFQTVTVSAVDDVAGEANPESTTVTIDPQPSGDAAYNALPDATRTVDVVDNEVAGDPFIVNAIIQPASPNLDVVYNEAVDCKGGNAATAAQFEFDDDSSNVAGNNDTLATGITQLNPTTCRLTFPAPLFLGANGAGSQVEAGELRYNAGAVANRIEDLNNQEAVDNDFFEAATPVALNVVSVTASAAGDTVVVAFSKPVDVAGIDDSAPRDTNFLVTRNGTGVAINAIGFAGEHDANITLTLNIDILAGDNIVVTTLAGSLQDNQGLGIVGDVDNDVA